MKKIVLLVLLLILPSLRILGGFVRAVAAYPPIRYQKITFEGDIIVDNDETFAIEDSNFTITGDIVVKDNARLIIRNTNLTITTTITTTIIRNHHIFVRDKAIVNTTNSKINLGVGSIILENSSVIYINNSTVFTEDLASLSQILVRDSSAAYIRKSKTSCRFYASAQSLVYIDESNILKFAPGEYSRDGNITVQVRDSYIDDIWAKCSNVHIWNSTIGSVVGSDSDICIENSKIRFSLSAYGNSKIALIYTNMPYGGVRIHNSSVLLRTLDFLPFVVLVPYQWVPWIELGMLITIIISISLAINFVLKRINKARLEKELKQHADMH